LSVRTRILDHHQLWDPSGDTSLKQTSEGRLSKIREDIENAASWIAEALTSSGYRADFHPQSLRAIDRFFDEHARQGRPVPGGLLAEATGSRLFALGSYVGEVVRRARGGEWIGDDDDPEVEINVSLRLPDGTVCWPIERVIKRMQNGAEDGIVAYGVGLGLDPGSPVTEVRPPKATKSKPALDGGSRGFFGRLFGRK
jgi:hypothetical protein